MSVLLMQLSGPLQAWGGPAQLRDWSTQMLPTFSGVLGIVAAAQGRSRQDDLSDLTALRFGVRADRPGMMLVDLQTTQPAPGQRVPGLGDEYANQASLLARKGYVADAVFLAALEGDAVLIDRAATALQHPHWLPVLGRRGCAPDRPVFVSSTQDDLLCALRGHAWIGRRRQNEQQPEKALLAHTDAQGDVRMQDVPLSWTSKARRYGYRLVRQEFVRLPSAPGEHDLPSAPGEHEPLSLLEGA